ncbi:hypothetical protein [Denitrobacterium detoxificans]|uniref:hypothetical protein n=1 Tax=Denitrobacterium detoxificans TaxID=79604 RepID=UPI0012E95399|nr:hypothetical protein [Denitrobacterium detoxificans]
MVSGTSTNHVEVPFGLNALTDPSLHIFLAIEADMPSISANAAGLTNLHSIVIT